MTAGTHAAARPVRRARLRFDLDELRLIHALLGVEIDAQESLGMEDGWSGQTTRDLYGRFGRVIETTANQDDPDT